MGISKLSLSFLTLVALLFLGATAHAQQPSPSVPAQLATASAPLATVNIQNASIVSQDSHTLVVGFDLTNRVGVQPHVRYSIQLIGTSAAGKFIADEYVFPDDVVLGENTTVHEQVTYVAPPSIQGKFDVYLQSKSDTGFPLAVSDVGKATFETATSGFEIIATSCYLGIYGETGSPKYALLQGVDIKPTETLVLHCSVANNSSVAVSLVPQYDTRYRSAYGDAAAQVGGDPTVITLKPHETRTIAVALPKASTPQAYNVLFSLRSGNTTSNMIDAHYVLQGSSATVQNITFDKDKYAQGDTAAITFLWSPSADGFAGSRVGTSTESATTVAVSLQSGTIPCASPITEALPQNPQVKLQIPVTHTCINPHVTVQLLAAAGSVLATGELTRSTKQRSSALEIVLGVAALLTLGLVLWFIFAKKRRAQQQVI